METAVTHLLVFLLQIPQEPQNPLQWPDVKPRRARIGDLLTGTPSSPVSQFFLFLHFVQMAVFPKTHPTCLCSFCFFFLECLSSPTSLTQLESKTSFNPPQMALPSFFSMAPTNLHSGPSFVCAAASGTLTSPTISFCVLRTF